MIFRKLLINDELILIATIALCTAIDPEIVTTINAENGTAINTENDTTVYYHLPNYIRPLHYDANIRLNYKTNDIIGECNITIHIKNQTEKISMHPVTFAIFKIAFYENFLNEKIYIPRYSFIHELNMLTIDFTNTPKLPKFLSPGKYTLIMVYMRHIDNNKNHFSPFLYSNENSDNTLKATDVDILTPQELFPCWNEITFNSTFKISIKHHKNYSVLSNMPSQTTDNDKRDMIWTHFEKSPLMLIQQIKVVITTFTNISTLVANVTFWSRNNVTYYLHLAKCITHKVLYFLKHENNKDKFKKIDYIVFWDNQHNTSETWGLIIHREADIIYNEDLDPIRHKMKVAYLITYQIISLWYDDVLLWSKTGFITLLATYILHQIPLDYNIMNLFIVETQWESFLFNTPSNANKINSLNYSVDYIKSSNIWRILHHLITADMFWTGIRTYVTSKQYHQTNDLENFMQIILNRYPKNSNLFIIKQLIAFWIEKNYYYPVLYVIRNNFITTNITSFQYLTTDFIEEDRKYLPTFVTYTTKSVMNFQEIFSNKSFWLPPQKSVIISEKFDENDWIIVNLQQTGYYRVNYDTKNWLKLAQYMNSKKYVNIHVLNRAQIIDDAFHFFVHKQLDYVTFWKISEFLSRETNYVVWYPMFKAFEYMTLKIPIKDAKNVKKKMEKILSGILHEIDYVAQPYESDLFQCLREEALKWACIIGNEKCREVANMQMTEELQNDTFVTQSASWKAWMYCNGFASTNKSILYDVFNKWLKTNRSNHLLLEYLTCFENLRLIKNYLLLLTEDTFFDSVGRNKHVHIFLLIIAKHAGNDIMSNFILERLNTYIYMYSTSTMRPYQIAIFIVFITHQHAPYQLNKVLEFVKTNLKEEQLVNAINKKIEERKKEYGRKISNYGSSSVS